MGWSLAEMMIEEDGVKLCTERSVIRPILRSFHRGIGGSVLWWKQAF
jgi:hypothetical protein